MNIFEKRKLNATIFDIIKKYKFKNYKMNVAGSAGLRSQYFFSDYDFNTLIQRACRPVTIYNEFVKILSNQDMYFIEFKIEYMDDSKVKMHDVTKLRKSMFKNIKFIKIDYVLWNEYHFKELSILYIFRNTKYSVDDIQADYNELIKEGNNYKALKRLFSIYKMTQNNKKEAVQLTRFFNSNKLYEINSNLKAIQLMKEHYTNNHDVNKKIDINVKYLKLDTHIDIDEMIKSNDKTLNNSAIKYLI